MDINSIATKADIQTAKEEIIRIIGEVLSSKKSYTAKKYLRSSEIQELLHISASTLQTMRIAGKIPYTKLSGILLYDVEQIEKILTENTRNIA